MKILVTDISDFRYVSMLVENSVKYDDVSNAIKLMEHLRNQAQIIDRFLADPRHPWNSVTK